MPVIHGFCSFYPFGPIRGKPLLRLTALRFHHADPGMILGFLATNLRFMRQL